MLLLIYCLCNSNYLWEFCVCLCFAMYYFVSIRFAIILKREKKLVALLLLAYRCIVTALPRGAVVWSAVCDCGICPNHTHLWSYMT